MQRTRQRSLSTNLPFRWLLPLLCGASLFALPQAGNGHAVWTTPTPRSPSDAWKDPNGPCGMNTRSTMVTTYQVGQQVSVAWDETVNHPGCFLIDFSTGGDQNWTQLANVKHRAGATPPNKRYNAMITLPSGVSCTDCTLRLRQIMLSTDTEPCPPAMIAYGATYYTCADVTIPTPPMPDLSQQVMPDLAVPPVEGGAQPGCRSVPPGLNPASAGTAGSVSLLLCALGGLFARRRRVR